jgi:hypothetical protein
MALVVKFGIPILILALFVAGYLVQRREGAQGGMSHVRLHRELSEGEGMGTVYEQSSFWEGKTPCWEMCHCPSVIRDGCPAYKYHSLPCWEIEGTYCKLSDDGSTGGDTNICKLCRVYRRYGAGEPVEIRLRGRGVDSQLKSLEKLLEEEASRQSSGVL